LWGLDEEDGLKHGLRIQINSVTSRVRKVVDNFHNILHFPDRMHKTV
jgi:hypothetical protein